MLHAPNDFDDPTSEEQLDPACVCYCLSADGISAVEQSQFGESLIQDHILRDQYDQDDPCANFLSMQVKLISLMRHETRMKKIRFDLDHGLSISQSDAAFLVIDSLPCSMHGEVRNTTLTHSVVYACGSKAAAIDEVKLQVTTTMSLTILGSNRKPHHWNSHGASKPILLVGLVFTMLQQTS